MLTGFPAAATADEIGLAAEKRRVCCTSTAAATSAMSSLRGHRSSTAHRSSSSPLRGSQPLVHSRGRVRLPELRLACRRRTVDERHIELYYRFPSAWRSIERHLRDSTTHDRRFRTRACRADFEAAKLHALKPAIASWACRPGTAERPRERARAVAAAGVEVNSG